MPSYSFNFLVQNYGRSIQHIAYTIQIRGIYFFKSIRKYLNYRLKFTTKINFFVIEINFSFFQKKSF